MAQSQDRMDEFMLYSSTADTVNIPYEWKNPKQIKDRWPLVHSEDLKGAIYHPTDGYINPADLTQAIARSARSNDVKIERKTQADSYYWDGKSWHVKCSKMTEKGGNLLVSQEKITYVAEHVVTATGNHVQNTSKLINTKIAAIPVEHQYFVTEKEKNRAILEKPLVLIVSSKIPNIRKIQSILEHVIKTNRSLLIIAEVDQQVKSALLMNKVKGNIKVNIIDMPAHGKYKDQTLDDLALITGAKVMNEELGDDLDLIQPACLGEVVKSVTDDRTTVLTTGPKTDKLEERKKEIRKLIKKEDNVYIKKQLEKRLSTLSGFVGVIKVGAYSKVEMKEKKDRVEDAIYAVKAALKEGIVPGGGVALLNAALSIKEKNIGEEIVSKSILSPFKTILDNAGIELKEVPHKKGFGIDVITGKEVDMIKNGIIDPVLVTKTALKNAISVVSTIISADCVISNIRIDNESN